MSIVVASGEVISKNILNHSVSKQMYSFPKTQRFKQMRKCTSATFLYNIPNKMSQRKTFIGYGNKHDFTEAKLKTNTPFYQVPRMFEGPHPEAPKYTFGLGRSYFQKVVVGNKISKIDTISPGPAKYSYLKPFGSFSPKYTVPKNKCKTAGLGRVVSPGPAKYFDNININPEGKYTLSKYSNTPRAGWSLSKIKRFDYNCK